MSPAVRRPRPLRAAGIMLLVFLGFLLACELLARLLLWRPPAPSLALEGAGRIVTGFSRGGYGDLLPDQRRVVTIYPDRPYLLVTNAAGLRNTDALDDDPAVFRILAIGDSYTFGAYVHNHEVWTARLQEALNQRLYPAARVQVLNAGIPGYTISDELGYLRDKGLRLAPDLVILGVYTNDVFDLNDFIRDFLGRDAVLASADGGAPDAPVAAFLRGNSALFNALMGVRDSLRAGQAQQAVQTFRPPDGADLNQLYRDTTFHAPPLPAYQPLWDEYQAQLRAFAGALNDAQIPLLVVAFPDVIQLEPNSSYFPVVQTMLQVVADEQGARFYDLLPDFRALPGVPGGAYGGAADVEALTMLYFDPYRSNGNTFNAYIGDAHLSPYGHLVTARLLAAYLLQSGVLP